MLENKTLATILGTMFVMLLGFFIWSNVTRPKGEAQSDLPALSTAFSANTKTSASFSKEAPTSSQVTSGKIFVDVKGAVKNEGVYELSNGSRVTDLVKKQVALQMMRIRNR